MASASLINPQTWNRYAYALNNPLRFTDPSGMIVSDFYNEDGKRLGADGVNDGKIYVVTNDAEAKSIQATNKQGGTTAVSAVTSAVEVPSAEVRQEIGAAVGRSNSPTADDAKGGFHEEGGIWGQTAGNTEKVVPAAAGAYSNPQANTEASIDVFKPANPADAGTVPKADGTFHVHPKGNIEITSGPENKPGVIVMGGNTTTTTYGFMQPPSPRDISNAAARGIGTNVVIGASDKKVYIYNGSGTRATMKLDTFLKLGKK